MRHVYIQYGKRFIGGLMLMISWPCFSSNIDVSTLTCTDNRLYCHILQLRPNIDKEWAYKFSNLLYKYAKKFKMDPMRSLAIAMQETSLKNQHRTRKVLVFYDQCNKDKCIKAYREVEGASDLSVFQFHVNTIKEFNIDPIQLNYSLEYAVKTHFELLKYKEEHCAFLKENAWACYHSKTPKYQKQYIEMVNRWYPKEVAIKPDILNQT